MKFLNKQEQVIDLQLTQHGKYLLSTGKFKPVYYAFFDDGILYDSSYANLTQSQKNAQNRIKNETPTLQTQYNFRGVESGVRKITEYVKSQEEWEKRFFQDLTIRPPETLTDTQYALQNMIGTSNYNSDKVPAWNVSFLIGDITSSATTTSWIKGNAQNRINIPQITASNIVYNTKFRNITAADEIETEDPNLYGNQYLDVFADKEEGILLDISQLNIEFEKEQYEIQVIRS